MGKDTLDDKNRKSMIAVQAADRLDCIFILFMIKDIMFRFI